MFAAAVNFVDLRAISSGLNSKAGAGLIRTELDVIIGRKF